MADLDRLEELVETIRRDVGRLTMKNQILTDVHFQLRDAVRAYIAALEDPDDRSGGEQAGIAYDRLRELVGL
jgi:hypothetical protein